MEYRKIYKFKAISYLKDPSTTKLWENPKKEFQITLAAPDLEKAIKDCRIYATMIPVESGGYHNSSDYNGNFCEILNIECGEIIAIFKS